MKLILLMLVLIPSLAFSQDFKILPKPIKDSVRIKLLPNVYATYVRKYPVLPAKKLTMLRAFTDSYTLSFK